MGIQQIVFGGRSMGDWEEGMTNPEYGYKYFKIWTRLRCIIVFGLITKPYTAKFLSLPYNLVDKKRILEVQQQYRAVQYFCGDFHF